LQDVDLTFYFPSIYSSLSAKTENTEIDACPNHLMMQKNKFEIQTQEFLYKNKRSSYEKIIGI